MVSMVPLLNNFMLTFLVCLQCQGQTSDEIEVDILVIWYFPSHRFTLKTKLDQDKCSGLFIISGYYRELKKTKYLLTQMIDINFMLPLSWIAGFCLLRIDLPGSSEKVDL